MGLQGVNLFWLPKQLPNPFYELAESKSLRRTIMRKDLTLAELVRQKNE